MKRTVSEFFDDYPDALAYHKRLMQVIDEKKIPLTGDNYDKIKAAYDYERRGIEGSIERWFEEEDQRAKEKFEREYKEEERKRNAKK
jgi:hypothetical protein